MYYFAYGRNMNPAVMNKRGVWHRPGRPAVLEGYELKFNKRSSGRLIHGYANIEPNPESHVPGVLYEVNEESIETLDRFEGYPDHYRRQTVEVKTDFGRIEQAICYIAQPDYVQDGLLPTQEYLNDLEAAVDVLGKRHFYHIAWIQSHPSIEDERNVLNEKIRLINKGLPEQLEKIRKEIDAETYKDYNGPLWGGASVMICKEPTAEDTAWLNRSAEHQLITSPHAKALSWCMHELKKVFEDYIQGMNKFYFYGTIAENLQRAIEQHGNDADDVLLHGMVDTADEMLQVGPR